MDHPAATPESLYRRHLGASFGKLSPHLGRFHGSTTGGEGAGVFHVVHGAGWLRNFAADRMSMPRAGEAVPLRLQVTTRGETETWRRDFGGRPFVTRQWLWCGLLLEGAGPMTLGLQVEADGDGLRFRTERAWFLGLPLPRWLRPIVTAQVRGTPTGWHATVTVDQPPLGRLIRYEGEVVPT